MSSSVARTDSRESMWAVRPRWSTTYFALFTFQVVVGFSFATYEGLASTTNDSWIQTYFGIIVRTGQVGIASAILTFTAVELLSSIMLMSEWIRQNLVEPAKERRREEGRAELIAEIRDWDTRRQTAEDRGEPFDEPPPYVRNGASDNHN